MKTNGKEKEAQNYRTIVAILSIVSFYTTFEGLKVFVFSNQYTWQAVLISVAVQGLLFLISISGFRNHKSKFNIAYFSKISLYIILLSISSFFSFVFISNSIYDNILDENLSNTIEAKYYEYSFEYSDFIDKSIPLLKSEIIADTSKLIKNLENKNDNKSISIDNEFKEIANKYNLDTEDITNIDLMIDTINRYIDNLNKSIEKNKKTIEGYNDTSIYLNDIEITERINEDRSFALDVNQLENLVVYLKSKINQSMQIQHTLLNIIAEIEEKEVDEKELDNHLDSLRIFIYSLLNTNELTNNEFTNNMIIYSNINNGINNYKKLMECSKKFDNFTKEKSYTNDLENKKKDLKELKKIISDTPYFSDTLSFDTANTVNKINDILYNNSDSLNQAQLSISLLNGRNNSMAIFALLFSIALDLSALLVGNINNKKSKYKE